MSVAINLNFLNESAPAFHFTDDDFKIFLATVQNALNDKKDGEQLVWKNDKTGHAGLIKPLNTIIENGTSCRTALIFNRANNKKATTRYKFCKQPDGEWKISPGK